MLLAVVLLFMLALPLLIRLVSVLVRHQQEQLEQRRPQTAKVASVERVAADLRRLRAQLEARENCPGTAGKGMKMGALRVAYVEVLGIACGQLDIQPPRRLGQPRTPLAEIYRVEAELRQRGLDVRPPDLGQSYAA